MPSKTPPSKPVDAYKEIIDELVERTPSMGAKLVIEKGIYSKALDAGPLNTLVESLSVEQRALLAQMLSRERSGAFHDLLAILTWWIISRNVGLTYRGEKMPVELSGMGLHGDYIGRLNDWEWPETND